MGSNLRLLLSASLGSLVCLAALAVLSAEPSGADDSNAKSHPKSEVKLPDPPQRISNAAELANKCTECHGEIEELLAGDKHIAPDFHCVVCHGLSKAHLDADVEGALPDRVWRRWNEDENRYEPRIKNAGLELARFCASCHAAKSGQIEQDPLKSKGTEAKIATIDWRKFLATGHGKGLLKSHQSSPACTDCHYAHGAGCEPITDETVIARCSLCHNDRAMMEREKLDPHVLADFEAGTHGDMATASADKKSSCIKCHYPH